jgi:hypothetical protein
VKGARALLVRVGADGTEVGGRWNAPVDHASGDFAYVPITEPEPILRRHAALLGRWAPAVERLGTALPDRLRAIQAHADPDFGNLTYGDRRERGRQIREKLGPGDALVFYAGLRDVRKGHLVYALIGLLTVEAIVGARQVPPARRGVNAHTRRRRVGETDIVVFGRPATSGRFDRCLPFATYRSGAYRVEPGLLEAWGGLGVRDGYVQRSARLPELLDPARFGTWLEAQSVALVRRDN